MFGSKKPWIYIMIRNGVEWSMKLDAGNSNEAALNKYKEGIGMLTQKMPEFAKHFTSFPEE